MKKKHLNYFSILFLLVIFYLSYLLVKPFASPLISAIIISYLLYPVYKKMNRKIKHQGLTILLILIIVITLIIAPLILITYSLIDDITDFIGMIRNLDPNSIDFLPPEIMPTLESLVNGLLNGISKFVFSIPNKILSIIVFLFATSLFLREGPSIIRKLKITIPLEKEQKDALFQEFQSVTKSMFYSIFLGAILNGLMGGTIFFLFGIPNALLWGFLITILSFIPLVGNAPIWIGGTIYMITLRNYLYAGLLAALGILSNQLENLIAMKTVGEKSKINSFLVFIGIVSGIKVFGPIGLIIGPLVLSILITLIRFYTKNYKKKFKIEK